MAIESVNSPALKHVEDLHIKYAGESPWLQEFQQQVCAARQEYDLENVNIDRLDRYPPIEVLEKKYEDWSKTIGDFYTKQERVSNLAAEFDQALVKLRWCCTLSQETFAKLTYLNSQEGPDLRNSYAHLRSRVTTLEENLSTIRDIATRSAEETYMLENHPHRRLLQTIGRCKTGQPSSSLLSWAGDKRSRNTTSIASAIFGSVQTTSRPSSRDHGPSILELPPSQLDEEDPIYPPCTAYTDCLDAPDEEQPDIRLEVARPQLPSARRKDGKK
jgi:hypothetical protein